MKSVLSLMPSVERNRKASLPIGKRGMILNYSRIFSILAEMIHKQSEARLVAVGVARMNQVRRSSAIKQSSNFYQHFLSGFFVSFAAKLFNRLTKYRTIGPVTDAFRVRGLYSFGARFMIWQSTVLSILSFKNRRVI